MKVLGPTELRNRMGQILDEIGLDEPVFIYRANKESVVIITAKEYELFTQLRKQSANNTHTGRDTTTKARS